MDVVVGFGPGVFPVGAGYTCLPFHVALGAGAEPLVDGLVGGLVDEIGGLFAGMADADEGVEAEAENTGLDALACAPGLDVLGVLGDAGAPK